MTSKFVAKLAIALGLSATSWLGASGCGGFQNGPETNDSGALSGSEASSRFEACPSLPDSPDVTDYPRGFHTAGNRIEDAEGNVVVLRGVNRSGSEYRCWVLSA